MNNNNTMPFKRIVLTLFLAVTAGCISNFAQAQSTYKNPYTPKEINNIPPVASLNDGVWLKGDLHVHSSHSTDGKNPGPERHPVAKIIEYAKSIGFGFIAITDHDNHVLGDVAHHTWTDPAFHSDSLLLLYGAEWTTTRGHGNVFSAQPYDHQQLYDVRDQRDAKVKAVKEKLGIHLSANHPSGKDHFGYSYDMVNSIEVWNSAVWPKNANAIMIWDDMLSSGRKLTGRGGSDTHAPGTYSYIGTPTTWVFAKNRTAQAVVDALTNGRVCVSSNPYAPRIEFYADLDQDGKMDMMMGDNVKATGKPVKFTVKINGTVVPEGEYTINIVKDGNPFSTVKTTGKMPMIEFTDTPAKIGRTFYRVTVQGPQTDYPQVPGSMKLSEDMVGLSNPIYFNFDPSF